jgi:hypothetical protein
MAEREITFVTIAGIDIPALMMVCPVCQTLDLNTDVVRTFYPWVAICSQGHTWQVPYRGDAA